MPSTETNDYVRELIGLGMSPELAGKIGDILEGSVDFTDLTVNDNLTVGGDTNGTGSGVFGGQLTGTHLTLDISATVSAAGNAIGNATVLTAPINNVTTVAASTGVQLPAYDIGAIVMVRNSGANALNVYPDGALIKINGGTDGAAVSLATTEVGIFAKVSATNWIGGVAVVF